MVGNVASGGLQVGDVTSSSAPFGGGDVFLARLTPAGVAEFVTYIGGSGEDSAADVVVAPGGRVFVVGSTTSADFPGANGEQTKSAVGSDIFVMAWDPTEVIQRGLTIATTEICSTRVTYRDYLGA